ncbi:MAG: RNA methyltransferase [Actinomycetia bacterium]|nr:RNA methyltransferase [Actinomycetes bacterium]
MAVLYSRRFVETEEHRSLLLDLGGRTRLVYVTDRLLDSISEVEAHQGVLAVIQVTVPEVATWDAMCRSDAVVVADGVQDPGNLGTLIRSAAASGAGGLGCTRGTVDLLNPKVLRASAGALFRLPVFQVAESAWQERDTQRSVYVATAHGGEAYDRVDWTRPFVLCLGNEARGVETVIPEAIPVRIPMRPGVESLNVAMAGTVLLFHVAQVRRRAGMAPWDQLDSDTTR